MGVLEAYQPLNELRILCDPQLALSLRRRIVWRTERENRPRRIRRTLNTETNLQKK
jgi:hypothetical protein